MKEKLSEGLVEVRPNVIYSSTAIKEIVDKHIAGIRSASLQLEGIIAGDIEYDNPEVHPQMLMDNLKDAGARLRVALLEIGRLAALTTERREQLEKAKIKQDSLIELVGEKLLGDLKNE